MKQIHKDQFIYCGNLEVDIQLYLMYFANIQDKKIHDSLKMELK